MSRGRPDAPPAARYRFNALRFRLPQTSCNRPARSASHCFRLFLLGVVMAAAFGLRSLAWADVHQASGDDGRNSLRVEWKDALTLNPAVEEVPLENSPALALDELLQIAQANSPALAQAAARVQAARGNWVQVGLPPNPTAGYVGSEIGQEGAAGQQGGFVGQEVVTGGKLRLNRAVAAQELRQAELEWQQQWLRVVNDARLTYYNVLVAQQMVELADQLVRIGEKGVDATTDLMRAQEVSHVDVLQARIELNGAQILLENARNRYDARWRQLTAVIGAPHMAPMPLLGDPYEEMPAISWDDALQRLLSSSPELLAARANLERARWAVSRAQAEPIPNFDFQASVQHDNATGDDIAGVQIGLPLPLWNRNQGGIRQAHAEVREAQGNFRRLQLELQARLAATYERYANARRQVEIYRGEMLPEVGKSLELVETGYRQGEFGYLVLLTSQRTYFQTHLDYLEAVQNLIESTVTIDGLLLTGSLEWQPE